MVRDVAMEQEVAGELLAQPRAALRLQVQRFRGPDHLHVHTVRLGPDHRVLHRAVLGRMPQGHLVDRTRAPRPANGAAMRMVGMEHLGAAMHQAELRRIAQVAARNRGRGVAERVGAVPHGLVLEPEILVLDVHVVEAERLAPVVQCPAARPIRIGQRITLRKEVAFLVHRAERLVADFMINDHKLAEVRAGAVLDDGLPAAGHRSRVAGPQRVEVLRPVRLHDERSEQTHHGQFAIVAVTVELPPAFLRARVDVPLQLHAFILCRDGVRVGRGRRLAGGADHHARPVDVQAHILAAFKLVLQGKLHAVPLVRADDQRLNPLVLEPVADRAGIISLLLARRFVLGLFLTGLFQILGQHVHVAGIEVQPLVDRDLDIDGRDVVLPDRRAGGTPAALHGDRLDPRVGHQH